MTHGPIERYRRLLHAGELSPDPAQEHAAELLELLHDRLKRYHPRRNGLASLLSFKSTGAPPTGLYFCGDVGRGKSMLMDLFFEGAPVKSKRRVHFHDFMQEVHDGIHAARQDSAENSARSDDDPIAQVAATIARDALLLCFDEFQVTDITDAMILGRLFEALFAAGVVVVATSNRPPDALYEGGLNRQLFLPFIETLKERLDILHLDGATDYRLERLKGIPVYHTPLDDTARADLDAGWARLTDTDHGNPAKLMVKGRTLVVPQTSKGVARFAFVDLCQQPLGAADYLMLAHTYHTILIDEIPRMGPEKRNEARRFITLIDTLYDNTVKLVCSADAPPEELYAQGDGAIDFTRTSSRLVEMQSADYMAKGHAV